MSRPLRREWRWRMALWLASVFFVLPQMISAQDCGEDIVILGSNYVCAGDTVTYALETTFVPVGNWSIDAAIGGTFTTATSGNQVDIAWDGPEGAYDVIVELADYRGGCVGPFYDTLTVEVVSTFGSQLTCNDTIQVSLGTDCLAEITPDMLLEGQRVTNDDYEVIVRDGSGAIVPNATVDGSHAEQYLEVSIRHICSGNYCWGYILVQDKLDPVLECQDVIVGCEDSTDPVLGGVPGFPFSPVGTSVTMTGVNTFTVSGLDSCGDVTLTYSDVEQPENCIGEETTSILYSADINGGMLHTRDTSNGDVLTSIQMTMNGANVTRLQAMATDPSTNELYVAVSTTGNGLSQMHLGIVDPASGVVIPIGPLNIARRWASMSFNSIGDKLYAVTGSAGVGPETIYEINKYTAEESAVCNIANGTDGEAIAFNPWTELMYSISGNDDSLRVFDLSNCTATGIDLSGTPLQGDGIAPVALAFDVTRGDLLVSEGGFGLSRLYRISTTGEVSFIGNQAVNVDKGLAFVTMTPFISSITRTWTATDESGNTDQCVETIQVRPATLLEVICPGDFDDVDNPALDCDGGWATDQNGHPDPSVTGLPTGASCSNIDYSYIDFRLDQCESSYKLIREWLIADWCTGEQIFCNQIIKVGDVDGPRVICPANDTFSVRPYECLGDAIAPNPLDFIVPDGECSGNVTAEVFVIRGAPSCAPPSSGVQGTTDGVFLQSNGDYLVTDLPQGCSWITYRFTDDCGNSSECTYDVFIREDKKPIAICDQHTVVTLSTTGSAKVFATTFDDGSYDNCEVDSFAVRRMSPGDCPSNIVDDTQFRSYVEFCCEDAKEESVMVVFRVFDKSMNFNDCMVEVKVVDKNAPVVVSPPDITVSCEFDFADINVFGEMRDNENDRESIIINDPANPNVGPNFNWGLDGYYFDDCHADVQYLEQDRRNDCGVGQIRRTWTISDPNTSVSRTQVITFVDFRPYDGSGIVFPDDLDLNGCLSDIDPDVTGRPVIPVLDKCADLLVTYEDQVYNIVQDACYKIIRSWTVVDWCNNNTRTNRWVGTQVIKILNTEPPVIESSCRNQVFNTVDNESCNGIATLEIEVSDDCTPLEDLTLTYEIDLDMNGIIDRDQTGDYTLTATNTYPVGTHEICWTVEDNCGNNTSCCYEFTMRDTKAPTPYCRPGIVTVVMPSSGSIEIWASDLDANSFDNCSDREDLRFSFSSNVNDNRRVYDCDDIPDGREETFELTIYVWDEAGNSDFCITQVIIQDGIDDVCPDDITGSTVNVTGNIVTEDAETVEEVMVMLDGSMPGLPKYNMTDIDGQFAFPSVPTDIPYTIGASRNDDHLNGVSTLDLILIQRHLLGISSFNTPFKHIAADVNNSSSISAGDISELRKLILGHFVELPKNKSWRFVLKDHVFNDPQDPWPFAEIMELDNVAGHSSANDFIAVKTGDVNGDARPNGLVGNVVRVGNKLNLNVEEQSFEQGDVIDVSIRGVEPNLFGLQLAYQFDPEVLQLIDVVHYPGYTSEANFGMTLLQDGVIHQSWNALDGNARDLDGTLVTFQFEAVEDGSLSDVFGLNTKKIVPEAYLEDLEVVNIEMSFVDNSGKVISSSEEFELFQNQPNPFDLETKIQFTLPRAQEAAIRIFDVTGKTIHLVQGVFAKGMNEVKVEKSQLSSIGVLYYRLETKDQMATRKMILIE